MEGKSGENNSSEGGDNPPAADASDKPLQDVGSGGGFSGRSSSARFPARGKAGGGLPYPVAGA